ncbi:hypothetical protein QNH10_08605 [Sporosarcina thermotolerans]|uniref:hypothetical protein n=1 Tax=Sporosarcina thermotolerans TaxID=633404 RepID=UPI0024BC0BC2|nr:hypothetical protein [Sporosarcina thermotolerans]WHT49552.1 hypothetical protein QNH10_08605 [Sporosarcina thermotolerans]
MNEVKKSLDAVSGFTSEDMDEVKQRIISGKRKHKKRNPLPAAITALVAAAVLFFAFNVLQDSFSTADEEDYDINELIYDFMLRKEVVGNGDGGEVSDEMRQATLQTMLQIDALIDYAKTNGYREDMEAIDKKVAEQRDGFYADLDKEGEDKKNSILKTQENMFGISYDEYFKFGISYDEYFNVLQKWTVQAEAANNWLVQHLPEDPITRGEVLGLFKNKNEHVIADFMEQKSIPSFDMTVKYEEHEGTVASIEGDRVLVTNEFMDDAELWVDVLIKHNSASYFLIDDSLEGIVSGMKIRVVYDALSFPVATEGNPVVYEKVKEWERLGSNNEPEYVAKHERYYLKRISKRLMKWV